MKENKCCKKCFSFHYTHPKGQWGDLPACTCHTPKQEDVISATEKTLKDFGKTFKDLAEYDRQEEWANEFIKKFFVSRLGGSHVGAQNEAIDFIRSLLKTEREALINRIKYWHSGIGSNQSVDDLIKALEKEI